MLKRSKSTIAILVPIVAVTAAVSIGYSAFVNGIQDDQASDLAEVASVIEADKRLSQAVTFISGKGGYSNFSYGSECLKLYYTTMNFANMENGLVGEARFDFQMQVDITMPVFWDYSSLVLTLSLRDSTGTLSSPTFIGTKAEYRIYNVSLPVNTSNPSQNYWAPLASSALTSVTPSPSGSSISATIPLDLTASNRYDRISGYFVFTISDNDYTSYIYSGLSASTINPVFTVSVGDNT